MKACSEDVTCNQGDPVDCEDVQSKCTSEKMCSINVSNIDRRPSDSTSVMDDLHKLDLNKCDTSAGQAAHTLQDTKQIEVIKKVMP